jgi:hypothetical protein
MATYTVTFEEEEIESLAWAAARRLQELSKLDQRMLSVQESTRRWQALLSKLNTATPNS